MGNVPKFVPPEHIQNFDERSLGAVNDNFRRLHEEIYRDGTQNYYNRERQSQVWNWSPCCMGEAYIISLMPPVVYPFAMPVVPGVNGWEFPIGMKPGDTVLSPVIIDQPLDLQNFGVIGGAAGFGAMDVGIYKRKDADLYLIASSGLQGGPPGFQKFRPGTPQLLPAGEWWLAMKEESGASMGGVLVNPPNCVDYAGFVGTAGGPLPATIALAAITPFLNPPLGIGRFPYILATEV